MKSTLYTPWRHILNPSTSCQLHALAVLHAMVGVPGSNWKTG